jgi:hypothetical protein
MHTSTLLFESHGKARKDFCNGADRIESVIAILTYLVEMIAATLITGLNRLVESQRELLPLNHRWDSHKRDERCTEPTNMLQIVLRSEATIACADVTLAVNMCCSESKASYVEVSILIHK